MDEMQDALRRGEGSDHQKHVLRLSDDKTVTLLIAKFGEETMAEILLEDTDAELTDADFKRWIEPILKGRGPVMVCQGHDRHLVVL
jgi:hypothetical protein